MRIFGRILTCLEWHEMVVFDEAIFGVEEALRPETVRILPQLRIEIDGPPQRHDHRLLRDPIAAQFTVLSGRNHQKLLIN